MQNAVVEPATTVTQDAIEEGYPASLHRAPPQTVLDAAESWLGATRVELEVFALNKRAIALYGSVGFEAEGVRRSMGWQDGDLADGIVMARVKG